MKEKAEHEFSNAKEWNRKERERLKRDAMDSIFHGVIGELTLNTDSIASIDNPMTAEEELERLAWEVNRAETNYWRAVAKYKDSGVSEVDQTPGLELDDYTNKHGR